MSPTASAPQPRGKLDIGKQVRKAHFIEQPDRVQCRDGHQCFPGHGIVGWDVFLTDQGALLNEANVTPGQILRLEGFRQGIGRAVNYWAISGDASRPAGIHR